MTEVFGVCLLIFSKHQLRELIEKKENGWALGEEERNSISARSALWHYRCVTDSVMSNPQAAKERQGLK